MIDLYLSILKNTHGNRILVSSDGCWLYYYNTFKDLGVFRAPLGNPALITVVRLRVKKVS